MKLNFDFSPWISPISGKRLLQEGYTWEGAFYPLNGSLSQIIEVELPSPVLIDLKLDIIDLRHAIDNLEQRPYPDLNATYILQQPDANFPNAQALNQLANGLMKNNAGVIQIALPNQDYLTPNLPSGKLLIGNDDDIATPQQTISIDNLPNLGISDNPAYSLSPGKIWRGTDSNRPEESDALSEAIADIVLLNARFLLGEFIMGDAMVQTAWPKAQFLVNLQDGILKKTGSTLQTAEPGVDFLDVQIPPNPAMDAVLVWADDGKKLRATNVVIQEDNIKCQAVIASTQVTANESVFGLNNVGSRELKIYDFWNGPGRLENSVNLKGPAQLNQSLTWIVPTQISTTGQVLMDIGANLAGERLLGFGNILPNNLQDGLLAQGRDADNNPIFVNAALTNGRFWQGDANNKPVEVELKIAPNDATYVIKQPNANLANAQVLSELGIGMAKIVAGGAFAIAIAGEDYATAEQLQEIEQQCQEYAEQASTSATEAGTSATEAAASATEATGAATEATGAAAAASGSATAAGLSAAGAAASAIAAGASAGSASSSASDASSSASNASTSASNAGQSATNAANSATQAQTYLNILLNTGLTLQGDVNGNGLLNAPIVTTFKPNPKFTGNESMTMPSGNSEQRPTTLVPGMIRFNTSL